MKTKADKSRFHAVIRDSKGRTVHRGNAHSGVKVRIDGWWSGLDVRTYAEDGRDRFDVFVTSGLNRCKPDECLLSIHETEDGDLKVETGPEFARLVHAAETA